MFAKKSLKSSKFWNIKFATFKILNSGSLGVKNTAFPLNFLLESSSDLLSKVFSLDLDRAYNLYFYTHLCECTLMVKLKN